MVLAHMLAYVENRTICRFGTCSDPSLVCFDPRSSFETECHLINCILTDLDARAAHDAARFHDGLYSSARSDIRLWIEGPKKEKERLEGQTLEKYIVGVAL